MADIKRGRPAPVDTTRPESSSFMNLPADPDSPTRGQKAAVAPQEPVSPGGFMNDLPASPKQHKAQMPESDASMEISENQKRQSMSSFMDLPASPKSADGKRRSRKPRGQSGNDMMDLPASPKAVKGGYGSGEPAAASPKANRPSSYMDM